jgi:hypothetical protein
MQLTDNKFLYLDKQKKKKHRDKKRDKDKELQASLMVACLKRLLPVGLNLFAGREQELVQHCKDHFLRVIRATVFLAVEYHPTEMKFEDTNQIYLAEEIINLWVFVNTAFNLCVNHTICKRLCRVN